MVRLSPDSIAALVANGQDLDRALVDAPKKDGGFSAVTLGWTLSQWRVADAVRAAGLENHIGEIGRFRDWLLKKAVGLQP